MVAVSYPFVAVASIGETGSTVMHVNLFAYNVADVCVFEPI